MNSSISVAADIMHPGCTCIDSDSSVFEASQMLAVHGIGALPICGPDDRLIGMVTDRDIVVKCIAEGRDPAMCEVAELVEGPLFWISDQTDIMSALALMEEHKIRRVPVIDDQHRLCGMLSQADIAMHLDNHEVGLFVSAISNGPAVQHAV